ncbi:MAG: hypothetical protein WCJ58_06705 [bacterium]
MNTATVQLRVPTKLKMQFEETVKADGLDVSTVLRLLMKEYSLGKIGIGVISRYDQEINQGKQDLLNGKYITAKSNQEIENVLDTFENE